MSVWVELDSCLDEMEQADCSTLEAGYPAACDSVSQYLDLK